MADGRARQHHLSRVRGYLLAPVQALLRRQETIRRDDDRALRVALGTLMAHQIAGSASSCEGAEFSVYSQFGEDGIVEYLIRTCDISPSTFLEIGVEDYREANTRFLAEHRIWRGAIVDQNPRLAADLAETNLDWRGQVQAVSAFVTRENVRQIAAPVVANEGLGLLSIDIDGVDYWILAELLDLEPAMIIVEYNSLFGPTTPVSVPYDAGFDRSRPEFHNVYYGAGLAAFEHLLAPHGYALVACVSAGNNAFFVRTERLRELRPPAIAEAYRPRRFAEHRALDGSLTGVVDVRRQLETIRGLPLVDVRDGSHLTVGDLLRVRDGAC
jgi:hypothetical protein